jgi:hypothetical protein
VDLTRIFIEVQWLLSVGLVGGAETELANFQKLVLAGQARQIKTVECIVGGVDDSEDEESEGCDTGDEMDESSEESSDDYKDKDSDDDSDVLDNGSEGDSSGDGTDGGPVEAMQVDKGVQ